MNGGSATTAANYTLTLGTGLGSLNANPDTVISVGGSHSYTLGWNSGRDERRPGCHHLEIATDNTGGTLLNGTQTAAGAGIGPPLLLSVLPIDAN